jgi:hypothetical protein
VAVVLVLLFIEGKPAGELEALAKRYVREIGFGSGPMPSATYSKRINIMELVEFTPLIITLVIVVWIAGIIIILGVSKETRHGATVMEVIFWPFWLLAVLLD